MTTNPLNPPALRFDRGQRFNCCCFLKPSLISPTKITLTLTLTLTTTKNNLNNNNNKNNNDNSGESLDVRHYLLLPRLSVPFALVMSDWFCHQVVSLP